MEERKPDIKKGILHRVQVLYVLFFIIGLMIVGKILYLQYGPKSGRLRSEGTTITYERVAMEADRGDILACDGSILATSVPGVRSADGLRRQRTGRFDFPARRRFAGLLPVRFFRRQKQERL